mmetsp:Transcript_19351/g.40294  ORF Transcript_19351/g.40294 Transcript_19351/m.40294 type:complete len:205 (+) Transcript_19351:176-790(+)
MPRRTCGATPASRATPTRTTAAPRAKTCGRSSAPEAGPTGLRTTSSGSARRRTTPRCPRSSTRAAACRRSSTCARCPRPCTSASPGASSPSSCRSPTRTTRSRSTFRRWTSRTRYGTWPSAQTSLATSTSWMGGRRATTHLELQTTTCTMSTSSPRAMRRTASQASPATSTASRSTGGRWTPDCITSPPPTWACGSITTSRPLR